MNVGLRLPTPSPSQSPANSARSISSRTSSIRSSASSKSNLPIGSARTQRSDIQAQPIKQGNVQKMLISAILATFDKKNVKTCHTTEILYFISFAFQVSKFRIFGPSSPWFPDERIGTCRMFHESDCSLNILKLNLDWVLNFHLHLAP